MAGRGAPILDCRSHARRPISIPLHGRPGGVGAKSGNSLYDMSRIPSLLPVAVVINREEYGCSVG